MIKAITRFLRTDSPNTFYTIEVLREEMMSRLIMDDFVREMTSKLADKFIEDHGDEILKRINQQVIDSKVIAKVVSNLRKELKASQDNP